MSVTKKKAKKPKPIELDEAGHKRELLTSTETCTKCSIECWVCMKRDSERDVEEDAYVAGLYKAGWRYWASEYFQTVGPTCPACMKIPETKRGR